VLRCSAARLGRPVVGCPERTVGIALLERVAAQASTVSKALVDQGFKDSVVAYGAVVGIDVEVVERNPADKGFVPQPKRWAIERTIGWLMMHRRLAQDYENRAESSQAMINLAMIDNVMKRITGETTPTWRDWPAGAPITPRTL
jgi:transposase